MKQRMCMLFLSVCFLFFQSVSFVVHAQGTEEQAEIVLAETSFGAEAAGEICTVRIFPAGEEPETQENFIYLNQGTLDSDGRISFSVPFRGKSGMYTCAFQTETGRSREELLCYMSEEERNALSMQEAYYLLDEDFNMLMANSGEDPLDGLWGWDILEDGGKIGYTTYDLRLHDTSPSKRLSIRRAFEAQTEGILTLDFRFHQKTQLQDDARIQLCSGDVVVAELTTEKGKLYLNGRYLQEYSAEQEYGIRLEADLTLCNVNGYVNGCPVGTLIPFLTEKGGVDNLRISTGAEATGIMSVKPIRLSRGYLTQEQWIVYAEGNLQNGIWQSADNGSVRIESMTSTTPPDVYSVVLKDASQTEESFIAKPLQNVSNKMMLEFKLYASEEIDEFTAALSEGLKLKIQNNILYVADADGELQQADQLPVGLWNTIQAKLNSEEGSVSLSVNGKKISKGFRCRSGIAISELRFSTGILTEDVVWIDDIYLKRDFPLPSDYVPLPQTREKAVGESLVGIQTCDLWREGKHLGWDKINQDYRRTPYLGFYDDGSPEVKDWEIKFMAEHGIDFSMHCWYRPTNGIGSPIKTPRNGASLHDGYFNAQYRDKVKFAIAWENGSEATTNEEDFRANIVPFWIEYYFKDPGYLILDNKPVIGVYNVYGMIASFGAENVKAQTDYIRQACRKAGFDGAWILGVTGSGNTAVLQKFVDGGFDAVYCYSWGTNGYLAESQKTAMMQQKDTGVIPIVPTLAMGRDDTPWRRGSGGFLSPGELKSLAEWAKEEFQPQLSADELGRRMILLDNWNEYGEGHFFMPAELSGFNYLEAIAQVYGAPQHTDIRPTTQQTERLCRLYPRNRKVPPLEWKQKLHVMPLVVKGWYFDSDAEGFSARYQVQNMMVQNGILSGTSIGTDPIICSPDDLGIDISNVKYIRVRMRNSTDSNNAAIYFTTEQDGEFNQRKAFQWTTRNSGGNFEEYLVPTDENPYWEGTLKQLRIDPSAGTGEFAFDCIELLGYADRTSGNLIDNGNMEMEQLPQHQGVECYLTDWEFHDGTHSMFCKPLTDSAELTYPVALKGGGSYLVSFCSKGINGDSNAELWIRYLKDGNLYEQQLNRDMQMNLDSGWIYAGGRIDLPNTAITSAQLMIKLHSADTACYLDDIMLYEISDPILAVEEAQFTDKNGNVLKTVDEANGTVIFTARLRNISKDTICIQTWLAAYQDKILQNAVGNQKIVLSAGASQNIRLQTEVGQMTAIKQFFWDSEMRPLKKFELK